MLNLLSCFFQIVFLTCLPPLVFGLAVWGCRQLFCLFVGDDSGRPLQIAFSALSTPLREVGHMITAIIGLHRIEDMCLLNLHDMDGEFGYVEHSYNPRNPVAVLGNLLYALGPVMTGLFAVLVICLSCFRGAWLPFLEQVTLLGEGGAGFLDYARTALSFVPSIFAGEGINLFAKIFGGALLATLCLGIHITPGEIMDAVSGFLIYLILAFLGAGVLILFDERVVRNAMAGLHTFATSIVALFLVVLVFAAGIVLLGFVFGIIRTLFNIDHVYVDEEES